jgi:hypothetical protein
MTCVPIVGLLHTAAVPAAICCAFFLAFDTKPSLRSDSATRRHVSWQLRLWHSTCMFTPQSVPEPSCLHIPAALPSSLQVPPAVPLASTLPRAARSPASSALQAVPQPMHRSARGLPLTALSRQVSALSTALPTPLTPSTPTPPT